MGATNFSSPPLPLLVASCAPFFLGIMLFPLHDDDGRWPLPETTTELRISGAAVILSFRGMANVSSSSFHDAVGVGVGGEPLSCSGD